MKTRSLSRRSARRRHAALILAGSTATLLASHTAHAADEAWSTTPPDATFTGVNWTPGQVPGAPSTTITGGDALFFGTSSITTLTDDEVAGFSIGGITFNAGAVAFIINGVNSNNLDGNITNSSTNLQTINIPLALTANRTVTTTTGGGDLTLGGAISGTGFGLTKAGVGTLTLAGANTYTGTTTIAAGTLGLSGGNDRLLNTGTVNFSGTSTLNLGGAISQTLGNLTVANGVTGTVTGATGTLTVTGASMTIGGTAASTSQTLDLSGLGIFNYTNAAGAFNVGGTLTSGTATQTGTVKLAPVSTITASSIGVGSIGGGNGSGFSSQGTLTLGATATTINADTITLGANLAQGTINYGSGTANPTLTLRGSAGGTSRVANLVIGQSAGFTNTENSSVNLTGNVTGTSTLDALIGTLTIGNFLTRGAPSGSPTTNGTLLMGAGTLDATTIIIGQNATVTSTGGSTITTTGTLTVGSSTAGSGTVKVQNLFLGNQNATASGANSVVTGTFNLNNGANLFAGTIDKGAGTGTRAATRTFNFNAGTIHNYDASTDLTINNNLTTFALLGAGTHTFNIDANRQGTVAQVISGTGAGGLTKAGTGLMTLSGANTYTGVTTVTAGTLLANSTTGSATGTGAVVVSGSASGTATLGGTGIIAPAGANAVTINTGGILAPGASIGTLTVSNAVIFGTAGAFAVPTLAIELAPSQAQTSDLLNLTSAAGVLTLDNPDALNLLALENITTATTFTIAQFASETGVFDSVFANGATTQNTDSSLANYALVTYNPTNIQVTVANLTAVPEPGALASLAGGFGMLLGLRRIRRRS